MLTSIWHLFFAQITSSGWTLFMQLDSWWKSMLWPSTADLNDSFPRVVTAQLATWQAVEIEKIQMGIDEKNLLHLASLAGVFPFMWETSRRTVVPPLD